MRSLGQSPRYPLTPNRSPTPALSCSVAQWGGENRHFPLSEPGSVDQNPKSSHYLDFRRRPFRCSHRLGTPLSLSGQLRVPLHHPLLRPTTTHTAPDYLGAPYRAKKATRPGPAPPTLRSPRDDLTPSAPRIWTRNAATFEGWGILPRREWMVPALAFPISRTSSSRPFVR